MNKPSISVVMPLYNKELEVARAIRSVLAQSFTDFELIIVNDGSTDRSVDQVNCFADARIRLVNQKNQGVSAARNRGVAESASDLVAFLDADDEWLPEFLATLWRLSGQYPLARVFATSYLMREPSGRTRKAILRGVPHDFHEGILEDYFSVAAQSDPPLWSSAIAVHKGAFTSVGGFPLGVRSGEDLLTWVRMASRWPVAYCNEALAVFWMPGNVFDRPGRFEDAGDPIGRELEMIYAADSGRQKKGIRAYLAVWHRMRAVIFLQLGKRIECLRSVIRAARFGGSAGRLLFIALLAICPCPRPARLFYLLKDILESRRSGAAAAKPLSGR